MSDLEAQAEINLSQLYEPKTPPTEFIPATQDPEAQLPSSESASLSDLDEAVPDSHMRALKRQNAMSFHCNEELEDEPISQSQKGMKKPRVYYYDPETEPMPDLDEYLNQWNLSFAVKIGICRTYANYLAASHRKK